MIRSISVRLMVSSELMDFAEAMFDELLADPDQRLDTLQELRMVETFSASASPKEKLEEARRALTWLRYERSPEVLPKPRCRRPSYSPLPNVEEGTFLRDLSDALDAARFAESQAA